tara:strand:+ start:163 stop:894 length:732 start_codon:yes stop_codon:yes gene_type:complete
MGRKVNLYLDDESLDLWNSLPNGFRSQIVRDALMSAEIPDQNRSDILLIQEKKRQLTEVDMELELLCKKKDTLMHEIFELEASLSTDTLKIPEIKTKGRDRVLEKAFQELLVNKGVIAGGIAARFSSNKVRAMKVHVGKGLWMTYVQRPYFTRVELYIYRGSDKYDLTSDLFDYFHAERNQVEEAFGEKINWDNSEDKNACRIEKTYNGFELHNRESWDSIATEMVRDMNLLDSALKPLYEQL